MRCPGVLPGESFRPNISHFWANNFPTLTNPQKRRAHSSTRKLIESGQKKIYFDYKELQCWVRLNCSLHLHHTKIPKKFVFPAHLN